jgi:hypothetical protein
VFFYREKLLYPEFYLKREKERKGNKRGEGKRRRGGG